MTNNNKIQKSKGASRTRAATGNDGVKWSKEDTKKVMEMHAKGVEYKYIAEKFGRSNVACRLIVHKTKRKMELALARRNNVHAAASTANEQVAALSITTRQIAPSITAQQAAPLPMITQQAAQYAVTTEDMEGAQTLINFSTNPRIDGDKTMSDDKQATISDDSDMTDNDSDKINVDAAMVNDDEAGIKVETGVMTDAGAATVNSAYDANTIFVMAEPIRFHSARLVGSGYGPGAKQAHDSRMTIDGMLNAIASDDQSALSINAEFSDTKEGAGGKEDIDMV